MTTERKVLFKSKSFVLGICNCELKCKKKIPIRNTKKQLQRYKHGHNNHHEGVLCPWWRGGKHIDTAGYVRVIAKWHPFRDSSGKVREHRLVMEKHLGRYLKKGEVVHHINNIKTDNRIENLQLMSHSEHSSFTQIEDMSHRICCICGNDKTLIHSKRKRPIWYYKDRSLKTMMCNNCYIRKKRRTICFSRLLCF